MKIDCHCHTIYSKHWLWGFDALNTPDEMIRFAMKKGFDGMAIVDHNDVKGSLIAKKVARRYKFKILTGAEIKTLSGDLIALGVTQNIPMRLTVEETVDRIHDLGGVAIAPHPFGRYFFRTCLGDEAAKTDAVEVFNATLTRLANKRALLLSKRFNKGKSAGSDAHSVKEVGNAGIICGDDPIEDIIKGRAKVFGKSTTLASVSYLVASKFFRSVEWRLNGKRSNF